MSHAARPETRATVRVHVGPRSAFSRGAHLVPLPSSPTGRPRRAIVVAQPDGALRAFVDLCRHLPIPLRLVSRRLRMAPGEIDQLPTFGDEVECDTHGARFRLRDGLCVTGPCAGLSLFPLELEMDGDGAVYVLDDTPEARPVGSSYG